MIEQVVIKNYKSIRDLSLPLNRLNVLIGSNGVGKSNFISFFELTKAIYEQRFGSYTLSKGGIDSLLYRGRKVSPSIHGLLDFDNNNAFFFEIKPAQSNKGFIEKTGDYFNNFHTEGKDYTEWNKTLWDSATLLLQSKTPEVIVIDEPELGLHPAAINKFAELVKRASNKSQIILSTQSTNLVNCFDVKDIIVVDRIESQSVFRHLSEEDLATWMDEYDLSISDLWEKNMIGGQL